jgi:hypothetical protein
MKPHLLFLLILGPAVTQSKSLCLNSENSTADYRAANASWVEPDCYNFSFTFRGFGRGNTTQERQIINGAALNAPENATFNTLQDFYDLIYRSCVLDCPDTLGNGTGADQCKNNYTNVSGLTIPEYIYIDPIRVRHYMNLE